MLSQFERSFFKAEFKILPIEISKWTNQEIIRLCTLLKVYEPLKTIINYESITASNFINISYLQEQYEYKITQNSYFPYLKLKTAIRYLSEEFEDSEPSDNWNFEEKQNQDYQLALDDEKVLKIRDSIDKLVETKIIELSANQLGNILNNVGYDIEGNLVKKNNVDGFAMIVTLTDYTIRKQIQNWFSEQEIMTLFGISILFLAQHYRQIRYKDLELSQKLAKSEETIDNTMFNSNATVEERIIQSHQITKKMSEQEIDTKEELGFSQILGTSQIMDTSVMGESEFGTSEMGESQYAQSVRGSVYYASSQYEMARESVDCRMSFNVIRTSFLYDDQTLNLMKSASLDLPFNLLNLEPLEQIKIRGLKTPFGIEIAKDHWHFSIQGVKFGRDKSNDLNFPDELSISSKHAQIIFLNDSFYLQDVGSKTGTYLRICKTLIVEQQTYLQLTPEIQIVLRIIKRNKKDGLIKAEIKKPENYPDYKISLREGYKVEIGRSEKCHIHINNAALAEKHVEIFYKNGSFILKNHYPKLGIWQRLSQKSTKSQAFKLKKGDIFRLSSKKAFIVQEVTSQIVKSGIMM